MPTKTPPLIPFQDIRQRTKVPLECIDLMKKHHLALNPNPNGCDDYLWLTFIPLGESMAGKVAIYKHNRLGMIMETAADSVVDINTARLLWETFLDNGWVTMDKVNY